MTSLSLPAPLAKASQWIPGLLDMCVCWLGIATANQKSFQNIMTIIVHG
jgi:hypothetical protein